jgi:hypothetical protein
MCNRRSRRPGVNDRDPRVQRPGSRCGRDGQSSGPSLRRTPALLSSWERCRRDNERAQPGVQRPGAFEATAVGSYNAAGAAG